MRKRIPSSTLFKCNVDYGRPGVTWANHESYLHRANPAALPMDLVPFFASRVYLGAGGLNPLCPGIQFSMSPRMHCFDRITSVSTTHERGIFNTRDEPLAADGNRRLHVICGDSLCSHTGLWLRFATTTLALVLAEAGLKPGRTIRLREPVKALHAFATDPSFQTVCATRRGSDMTALEVQRHYLELAEAHVDHGAMPDWAVDACRVWRGVLDRLGDDTDSACGILDWAMKAPLYRAHIEAAGVDLDELPHWNHLLTFLRDCLRGLRLRVPLSAGMLLDPNGPLAASIEGQRGYIEEHALDFDRVETILELRAQICEIDMRFGQLGDESIFAALEPELDHEIPGVDRIDEARTQPPDGTRAKLRGQCIRKYAGKDAYASWTVVARPDGKLLDLSNPLESRNRWKDGDAIEVGDELDVEIPF
ncbi:MAG: hypothetical protein CMJ18_15415 [Phycisphaeraceae bacterium]|nr:hypothetical protein [Phycisphaeraceae bacterium]